MVNVNMVNPLEKSHRKIRFIICGLLLFWGAPDTHAADSRREGNLNDTAQSTQPGDRQTQIERYQNRQKNIRREIEKSRQEVEAFSRQESDIIKRLEQVEQALDQSRKRAAALGREIKRLDAEISNASATSEALHKRIKVNEDYLAKRLVAVYKMNWLGKIHLLASAETMHEFIQRKAALEHILAYDERIRSELIKNQVELQAVLIRLEAHQAQKSERAAEHAGQIKLMAQERATRKSLLADIRSQKALELAAIDALTQSANELNSKIESLSTKTTGVEPDNNFPQKAFSDYKGLLIRPVEGKIISLFGPYKNPIYNITNFRSGIDIEAVKGEPIRSVFWGKIIYSNWFKGYGNMIIIDHGSNYYTVYAHLEETFKNKGDVVETGEVIATVGDTGSMAGTKLYFEVRHHGKPVDPLTWLKKG
jgi:septal ring factor EnvC (AmiA/AmiB activator)